MNLRKLPGTAAAIPSIGQGATRLGTRASHNRATVDARIAALRHGVARGLTYIDTAPLYGGGFSEEVVGEALAGIRGSCFLATKVHLDDASDHRSVRQSIRDSLKRLRTDYLDLVQIHWPNPFARQGEIMAGLEAAVVEGDVRHIGVSNYCAAEIRDAQKFLTKTRIVTNQYEFNLLDRCVLGDQPVHGRDALLIAYSPLNQGRMTASLKQSAIVGEIASDRGVTPAQVVLAAVMAEGHCVAVVRASSIRHVDDAAGALDLSLSPGELARIHAESPAGPELISPELVDLVGTDAMPPYRSAGEARANRLSLIPSPVALAERIRSNALPMPLRVHRKAGGRYLVDAYDPMDQVKKYWSWAIANPGAPIPAYVLEG